MIKKYITLLVFYLCICFTYAQVDYDSEVQPIFDNSCMPCHNSANISGGLDLTSYENVMAGGVIVPGDLTSSILFQEVLSGSMPNFFANNTLNIPDLNNQEIAIIESWILEGALSEGSGGPWDIIQTDCNMTVLLPADLILNITVGGVLINPPEPIWIGIANQYGVVCGGSFYEPGVVNSISVWGAEAGSDSDYGMEAGEDLNWVVFLEGSTVPADADVSPFDSVEYSCSELFTNLESISATDLQEDVFGCTDGEINDTPIACNYNPEATIDDGSCEYAFGCDYCSGETDGTGFVIDGDIDGDGVCDEFEIEGCTDEIACNFDSTATELCSDNLNNNTLEPIPDGIPDCCDYFDICGVCDGDGDGCQGCADGGLTDYTNVFGDGPDGIEACNYGGPSVTIDDGSCTYECYGCTDNTEDDGTPIACNYDDEAIFDDGSCTYECYGCTDGTQDDGTPVACNYNPDAIEDDGSCEYTSCIGCLDDSACNYDSLATIECPDSNGDGDPDCCLYVVNLCDTCENGVVIDNDADDDGVCDADEIEGCADGGLTDYTNVFGDGPDGIEACNYNENATEDDGSCVYVNSTNICGYCSGETDGTGTMIPNDEDGDGECDECNDELIDCVIDPCPADPDNDTNDNGVWDCEELTGCTDPNACNYDCATGNTDLPCNDGVNVDDGSCFYPDGCTDPIACNYDSAALCDDGSCILPDGCTNDNSCNYDPDALCDDGSCTSLIEDDSCFICIEEGACNYTDPDLLNDDDWYIENNSICSFDTCCDDPDATNYDENCLCPDPDSCFNVLLCGEVDIPGCEEVEIFAIPVTSSYGPYQVSCFGANDGVLSIDFNTMNLASNGTGPYTIEVWRNFDADGLPGYEASEFVGVLTESDPQFTDLYYGDYTLYSYDVNGCCQTTIVSMNEPRENSLCVPYYVENNDGIFEYDFDSDFPEICDGIDVPYDGNYAIACPGGETDIDFFIRGDFGQFDILVNGDLEFASVDGGTVDVATDDYQDNQTGDGDQFNPESDGIPDGFVQLNTGIWISQGFTNPNFWPELYNECDGVTNNIVIQIEGDPNLNTGDLVGAFYTAADGSLQCFGYNEYVASSDGSSFFFIEICEGEDNGFYDGEEVVFLVYDSNGIPDIFGNPTDGTFEVWEVDVVYDPAYSSVFNTEGQEIFVTGITINGIAGSVPDFTLTVPEGSYDIQINRSDSVDSNGDGNLDDVIVCSVETTTVNVSDPDDFSADIISGGSVCNYITQNGDVVSDPNGVIDLIAFSGGTPPYSYTWINQEGEVIDYSFTSGDITLEDFDGDEILDDLNYVTAGEYTLNIVDDNGCLYDTIINIIGSDIQLSELSIDAPLVTCVGATTSVEITLDYSENSPYSLTILSNNTSNELYNGVFDGFEEIDGFEQGDYLITITDVTGCSIDTVIDIDVDLSGIIVIYNPLIEQICNEDTYSVSFVDGDNDDDNDGILDIEDDNPFDFNNDGVDDCVGPINDCDNDGLFNEGCIAPDGDTGPCFPNESESFDYGWYLVNDVNNNGILEYPDEYIDQGYSGLTATLDYDQDGDGNSDFYIFRVVDLVGDTQCVGEYPINIDPPDAISFSYEPPSLECYGDSTTILLDWLSGGAGAYDFSISGSGVNIDTIINLGGASSIDFNIDNITGILDVDANTDGNATYAFGSDVTSLLNIGDLIGFFYQGDNGFACGGSLEFSADTWIIDDEGEINIIIPVWQDDGITSEVDGFENGTSDIWLLIQPVTNPDGTPNLDGVIYYFDITSIASGTSSPETFITNNFYFITGAEVGDEFVLENSFETDLLGPGSYLITAQDANLCEWEEVIEIEEVLPYEITLLDLANPICDGTQLGEISVQVSGGTPGSPGSEYLFLWVGPTGPLGDTNNGTESTVSGLGEGEYSLVVIDNAITNPPGGCIVTETFSLSLDVPEPESINIINENCPGDGGAISVCGISWEGVLAFSLNNSLALPEYNGATDCYTLSDLNVNIPYNFGITSVNPDNGSICNNSVSFIIDPASPWVFEMPDESELDPIQCNGGTTSIVIEVLEGTADQEPFAIDWQGLDTESVPAGVHSFIITDDLGCSETFEIQIDEPDPIIIEGYDELVNSTCFDGFDGEILNASISGGSLPYSYSLINSNSLEESILDDDGSSFSAYNLEQGLYTLIVTDDNGCEEIFDQYFTINSTYNPIQFEDVSDQNTTENVWELNYAFSGTCYGDNAEIDIVISNPDLGGLNGDLDFEYYWYELINGTVGDWDGDGILNSETLDQDLDGLGEIDEDFVEIGSSSDASTSLPEGYYFVIAQSEDGCLSDTVLFEVETPGLLEISVDNVNLECHGDKASIAVCIPGVNDEITNISDPTVFVCITGGGDEDIDGDGIVNWLDEDIDGDGILNANGDCVENCNNDDSNIDNDGVDNYGPDGIPGNDDDDNYLGGYIYNGLSVNAVSDFSNGPMFEICNSLCDSNNPEWIIYTESMFVAGLYQVSVIDSDGCSASTTFEVIEPPILEFSADYNYNDLGSINDLVSYSCDNNDSASIELLCDGDFATVVADPFGGTPPYSYVWKYNGIEIANGSSEMSVSVYSEGCYELIVYDSQQCQQGIEFIVSGPPELLDLNANGELQYNDFHVSCFGASDGVINFTVNEGTPPYNIAIYNQNGVLVDSFSGASSQIEYQSDNLSAGFYEFEIIDDNYCSLVESIELIEPDDFIQDVEYVIDASCDEESDGMIIIRTLGGNPPLYYTVDASSEIDTTYEDVVVVYENDYDVPIMEEVFITEADILIADMPANTWHTVTILNDEYQCIDSPVSYSLYVGSQDTDCLFIPSIFTPNGDGINDTWEIHGIDLYSNINIQVFNRWGQIVYESEGEYVPWDGVSQASEKNQAIATYYYVLNLNIDDKKYNGSVTIKR